MVSIFSRLVDAEGEEMPQANVNINWAVIFRPACFERACAALLHITGISNPFGVTSRRHSKAECRVYSEIWADMPVSTCFSLVMRWLSLLSDYSVRYLLLFLDISRAVLLFICKSSFLTQDFTTPSPTAPKGSAKVEGAEDGRRHGRW